MFPLFVQCDGAWWLPLMHSALIARGSTILLGTILQAHPLLMSLTAFLSVQLTQLLEEGQCKFAFVFAIV